MLDTIKTKPYRKERKKSHDNPIKNAYVEYQKEKMHSKLKEQKDMDNFHDDYKKSYYNLSNDISSSRCNKSSSTARNIFKKNQNDSTFYHSKRELNPNEDRFIESPILDDLMYFVDNSPSIIRHQEKVPKIFEMRKEYFADTDSLYKSIYHQNKFSNRKKKNISRAQSCSSKINMNKSQLISDNVSQMSSLVCDIQHNIINPIEEDIRRKEILQEKYFENISTFENINKNLSENFKNSKSKVLEKNKENLQMKHLIERVSMENFHMIKENKVFREEISEMKTEIYLRDCDTNEMNTDIAKLQSEINFFKLENAKFNKKIAKLQEYKKSMRTNLVLFKKENDLIKEKVEREEQRNKRFVAGVSLIAKR